MVEYNSRETRHKFIAEKFGSYLNGSVLNIGGGGQKHMLKYIQPKEYLELDVNGHPDLKVDLDKSYPLPIESRRFDTVICTDVLEHLEELHRVFQELIRISNKYIIISVPNALTAVRNYIKREEYIGDAGEAGIDVGRYTKFYGLPLKKPHDRHRWFFSYTEAEEFFHKNAQEFGYKILAEYSIGSKASSLKGKVARLCIRYLMGEHAMKDWFCSSYWCVLEKHPHERSEVGN